MMPSLVLALAAESASWPWWGASTGMAAADELDEDDAENDDEDDDEDDDAAVPADAEVLLPNMVHVLPLPLGLQSTSRIIDRQADLEAHLR